MEPDVMVSVAMIAYKHEPFIAQSIESIVTQKTNFKFKLVIGEDKSPDNTRKICEYYAEKYPDIVVLLPSDKNLGMMANFVRVLDECHGKYLAICEGDDYWLDEYKLQKQYDLMEKNPDKVLCFTQSRRIDVDGNVLPTKTPIPVKDKYTLQDILKFGDCYILTATLFFRNLLERPLPPYFTESINGDISVQVMLLTQGDAICLFEETAVYRKHSGGITNSQDNRENGAIKLFKLFEDANKHYQYKFNHLFQPALFNIAKTILIHGSRNLKGAERQSHIRKYFAKYFKYRTSTNIKEILHYVSILYFGGFIGKLKSKK